MAKAPLLAPLDGEELSIYYYYGSRRALKTHVCVYCTLIGKLYLSRVLRFGVTMDVKDTDIHTLRSGKERKKKKCGLSAYAKSLQKFCVGG